MSEKYKCYNCGKTIKVNEMLILIISFISFINEILNKDDITIQEVLNKYYNCCPNTSYVYE